MSNCLEAHNKIPPKYRALLAIVTSLALFAVGAMGLGLCPKYDYMACEDLPCKEKPHSDPSIKKIFFKFFLKIKIEIFIILYLNFKK